MNEIQEALDHMCGACHKWGNSPVMVGGYCSTCDRSHAEIMAANGTVELDPLVSCLIFAKRACSVGRSPEDVLFLVGEAIK